MKETSPRPRELALKVLFAVNEEGAYTNIAIDRVLGANKLDGRERHFVTELVNGTVKARGTLDWILGRFLKGKLEDLPAYIREILRLGAYQLLYVERVPASAACNESVELAKRYGHAGTVRLVNGVLRNLARRQENLGFPDLEQDPLEHISLVYYHPRWMIRRWLKRYGVHVTIEICRANNRGPDNFIRVNTLKTDRQTLLTAIQEAGVEADPGSLAPESIKLGRYPGFDFLDRVARGGFTAQGEASMLVAHALGPQPGETVLDACAAPGTKTTHIAQLMGDRGKVLALDVHEHRLKLIREGCQRLGITSVLPFNMDARLAGETWPGEADAVLVDAPCSGMGVLGRRADARWRKEEVQITELARLQGEILDGVVPAIKPGGVLVYSTCSIEAEENQEVSDAFDQRHPGFVREAFPPGVPWHEIPGGETAAKGSLQLLPGDTFGEGFYICRWRKRG